jgi:hypothetical protein
LIWRTRSGANTIGTELSGVALICTRATVIAVGVGIDAKTIAIGQIGGTIALRIYTDLYSRTFVATTTTIIGIARETDAYTGAIVLIWWTRSGANTIGTELSGVALICTRAAVIAVGVGIDAKTIAIGLIVGAKALAAGANFITSAFDTTGATMVSITVGISTRARARDLIAGA